MGGFTKLGIFSSPTKPEIVDQGLMPKPSVAQLHMNGNGMGVRSPWVQDSVDIGEIERQVREKMDRHRERRRRRAMQREE